MDEDFYMQLTELEKEVFDKYKSNENSFAYNINNKLRTGEHLAEYEREITILDEIVLKNSYEEEKILHRATVENLVSPHINGQYYINPDFLSTGTDLESIQVHFTNPIQPVYLKIICPPGTNMAPLESNQLFNGMENEMLIGRNNYFLVLDNRVTEERQEIEQIMDRFNARGVSQLRIITIRKEFR